MKLRENQIQPVEAGVKYMTSAKAKPSIIVAPTAFGKSIVIAEIVRRLNEKVIVLQPSKELLEQNYSKFINLGGEAQIFSASMGIKELGSITYATIGSIKKIAQQVAEFGITKIIIDECDRFPRENTGMLRTFIDSIKATHVLGLTATPLKLQTNTDIDGNKFSKWVMLTSRSKKGNFFKDIIHVEQIQNMLELGFWTPLVYEESTLDSEMLAYNSSRSDYTEESIIQYYLENSLENRIIKKVGELTDKRAILVAVPTIKDAESLARKLTNASVIHSQMKRKERQYIIEEFKSGNIKTIVQVNVLTVGFDYPELDCLIAARPTSSLSWWYQFLGRGTRIHPSKKETLVIDFVGSVKKFGKIKDLVFKKDKANNWQLYGKNDVVMTSVPIDDIGSLYNDFVMPFGKFKGKSLRFVPDSYKKWMLKEFDWNTGNTKLREALLNSTKI